MQLDKSSSTLPKRSELPEIPDAPPGAAWLWGKDDEVRSSPCPDLDEHVLGVVLTIVCSCSLEG